MDTPIHQALAAKAVACGVPAHLIPGLVRYIVDGIRPGGFLCAVIGNELFAAVGCASDDATLVALKPLLLFLHNEVPGSAVGSREAIARHIARREAERQADRDPADIEPMPPLPPDTSYLTVRHPNGSHR